MDFNLLIQRKRERFEQLEREIADPSLFENRNRAGEIMREHANVKALAREMERTVEARECSWKTIANWPIRPTPTSPKWRRKKFPPSKNASPISNARCRSALLPPDENENRDAIIEIRAGTGGSEAAIFAADLYRMYNRYAESAGLKIEIWNRVHRSLAD